MMEDIQDELIEIAKIEKQHELKKKPETEILYCVHIIYLDGSFENIFDASLEYISDRLKIPVEVLEFNNKFKGEYNIISNYSEGGFNFLYVTKAEIKKGDKIELIARFNEIFKYDI